MAVHNNRPFLIHKTVFKFDHFLQFVTETDELSIYPSLQEAAQACKSLQCDFKHFQIDKAELRHSIALYTVKQIRYNGNLRQTFKSHFIEMGMDETRFYYAYKMAKDFVILARKDKFSLAEIKSSFFEKGALVNYLNDLAVQMVSTYIAYNRNSTEPLDQKYMDPKQFMSYEDGLQMSTFFINFDVGMFFHSELAVHKSVDFFQEELRNMYDFGKDRTPGSKQGYHPIVPPRFEISYFEVSEEF